LIAESATRAKACPHASVIIRGLGDNHADLAARRAAAVAKALAANGLGAGPAQIEPTPAAEAFGLLHRRAEVSVHFTSR
jgi:outer membrane protein OmpA-like peptidoglycan-associated protein